MSRGQHYLKIKPEYYRAIAKGVKNFEVRYNDRNFHVGDMLHLQECVKDEYTGREILAEVTYLLDDPTFCKEGYVVMAIKVITIND